MSVIARIALLMMVGVFVLNVVAGLLPWFRHQPAASVQQAPQQAQPVPVPSQGGQGTTAQQPAPSPPPREAVPEAKRVVEDPAVALSTVLGPYGVQRQLGLREFRLTRDGDDIVVSAVAALTPQSQVDARMAWYLAVDAHLTALVDDSGTWYTVRSVEGLGLVRDGDVLRSSPPWPPDAPRKITLRFRAPSGADEVLLQVGWRTGTGYGYDTPVTRTVRVALPKAGPPKGTGR